MTPCLTPAEFVDLADGVLPAARVAHVAGCVACRGTAADLAATMAEVTAVDVPEPAPFFWAAFNRRVRAAIDDDGAARPWHTWRRWRWMAPLAGVAAALVVVAVTSGPMAPGEIAVADPMAVPAEAPPPVATAPDGADRDDALALVLDLADALPEAAETPVGLAPLPDLGEVAAATLSADELRALEDLLRAAVDRPTS